LFQQWLAIDVDQGRQLRAGERANVEQLSALAQIALQLGDHARAYGQLEVT